MLVVLLLTSVVHDAGSILAEVIQLDGDESRAMRWELVCVCGVIVSVEAWW